MLMNKNTISRNYWLGLAAMYGLTLSVVAVAEMPWPLIMGGAFILFAVLHSIRYRQLGRKIQGKLATASPGVGVVGAVFGAAAVLIHGTPIALWAGPLLGIIAFLGMYLYLHRFGRFYSQTNETAT
jgi:heme A synthase